MKLPSFRLFYARARGKIQVCVSPRLASIGDTCSAMLIYLLKSFEDKNMSDQNQADSFVLGGQISFAEANALWKELKASDDISKARKVLARMSMQGALTDVSAFTAGARQQLCTQLALLTSKDQNLSAAVRHDEALAILRRTFSFNDDSLNQNAEVLGVAAGILKRKWQDLGKLQDLQEASALYDRGSLTPLGDDAYPHINAAFLHDLLASLEDDPTRRTVKAKSIRERIASELPVTNSWFNAATRAEAFFGLGRYEEAGKAIDSAIARPQPWELRTTVTQLAHLAQLQDPNVICKPVVKQFFETLLPGRANVVAGLGMGKVGLALSGGGFRASYYHLGVLAKLAERDMLKHVEVLSCVSGGSIVGTCYWLALRKRMLDPKPMARDDYVLLIQSLITQFHKAVKTDLRAHVQPTKLRAFFRLATNRHGAIDSEKVAFHLEEHFFRGFVEPKLIGAIFMDQLGYTPADHDPGSVGPGDFSPNKHNWLREHKVPALVLNATSMNTGHAWQCTVTWMGESPWAIHKEVNSITRLEWAMYSRESGWRIALGRAVAASACVPGLFDPISIGEAYEKAVQVQLVDGGVYDNQGTVALIASDCNTVLVSDACGQLMFQEKPKYGIRGLASHAIRAMAVLMERIRQANFTDLKARKLSGQLREFIFVHMKAGLHQATIARKDSQRTIAERRTSIGPSGIRQDFQKVLAEVRTDLNQFSDDEAHALMACGYQMSDHAIRTDIKQSNRLVGTTQPAIWCFEEMLKEIMSTADNTPRREGLLAAFARGR
jgi:predicted acylesterase/phospholipase RssA